MFIIPDDILETLVCSVCEKYLSVRPVKVYPDGSTKCGRCSLPNDNGIPTYEALLENGLYKCVNRYEGCKKVLSPTNMLVHEETCIGNKYLCPKCGSFRGSAYQLMTHYKKKNHGILSRPNITVNIMENKYDTFLYCKDDTIYFITITYTTVNGLLKINTAYLGSKQPELEQQVKLSVNNSLPHFTKLNPCVQHKELRLDCDMFTFDIFKICTVEGLPKNVSCSVLFSSSAELKANTLKHQATQTNEISNTMNKSSTIISVNKNQQIPKYSVTKQSRSVKGLRFRNKPTLTCSTSIETLAMTDLLTVKFTEEFKSQFPGFILTACGRALVDVDDVRGHRINLYCCKCKEFTGSNVFSCQGGEHIFCWDCKDYECPLCGKTGGWFHQEMSSKIEILQFPCRYLCEKHFMGGELRDHELACRKNLV